MTVINVFLFVFGGITAVLLVAALLMRKAYDVQRSIIIEAPRESVFGYLKQLKNQDNFNKWVMVDPNMRREFVGTDGTAGFIYRWNGNKKAGEGELELKSLIEDEKIETEIRFVRPFPAVAYADYVIESASNSQTKVIWSSRSKMAFPMNAMVPVVEKMLAKDMDVSLSNLKAILEKLTSG